MYPTARKRSAFSLIELVIVVVIIGIIAAIAIPRMSRGAQGASDSSLIGDLAVLRKAIDLYAAEHNGSFPTDNTTFTTQLTTKTDINGLAVGSQIYGPYIRAIPPLPVGTNKGQIGITATAGGTVTTAGWVYTGSTGTIIANTTTGEKDASGALYNTY